MSGTADGNAEEVPGGPPPTPLAAALDTVMRRLSGAGQGSASLLVRWPELVGEEIARHATPVAVRAGDLVLAVPDPVWASQLRWLERDLLERIVERGGPRLDRLTLRVGSPACSEAPSSDAKHGLDRSNW
jgi:predicted nucleic acid-binding Zn ribbon protein